MGITITMTADFSRPEATRTSPAAAEQTSSLDLQVIRKLAESVDSPAIAVAFLSDYFALLPRRMERILAGLQEKNKNHAIEAITGLRTSSAMTGAAKAEASCQTMEAMVRKGSFVAARVEARNLSAIVAEMLECAPFLVERAEAITGCVRDNGTRKTETLAG